MRIYQHPVLFICALFICISGFAQQPLNQINIINLSVKNKLPADISSWDNSPSSLVLVAQKVPQASVHGIKLSVQIKQNGTRVCGAPPQSAALLDSFTIRNFSASELSGSLSQCGKLKPGSYSFCVQFYNIDNYPISREACKEFMVEDQSPQNFTAPQNLSPAADKIFKATDMKAPLMFRWTPVVPKPKENVTYRLRVWQLMQGQTGTQAIRANNPVLEKDVANLTQAVIVNLYTGPCKPPYLCDFIWNVQVIDAEGKLIQTSEPSSFMVQEETETIVAVNNISPENKKQFTQEEMKGAVDFRWTPILPRPKEDIVYRLKVWQLMQGQNGTQAMRTNQPVLVKAVNREAATPAISEFLTGPCKPPYLCDFIWAVETVNAAGKVLQTSEPFTFSVKEQAQASGPIKNISPDNTASLKGSTVYNQPVVFEWGISPPFLTTPQGFRLKVWQLMEGQNGIQAMRTNQPIIEKEVKDQTQKTAVNMLTGPCKPPYLCDFIWTVEGISAEGKVLQTSKPTVFSVQDETATPGPVKNISPIDQKIFTPAETASPVMFRWTPVVPKPKEPVSYKLKVWQLMQGQSSMEAMRTNQPIIEKEVKDQTQKTAVNIFTGPCKPPYLCDFVWAVETYDAAGKLSGTTESFMFSVNENAAGQPLDLKSKEVSQMMADPKYMDACAVILSSGQSVLLEEARVGKRLNNLYVMMPVVNDRTNKSEGSLMYNITDSGTAVFFRVAGNTPVPPVKESPGAAKWSRPSWASWPPKWNIVPGPTGSVNPHIPIDPECGFKWHDWETTGTFCQPDFFMCGGNYTTASNQQRTCISDPSIKQTRVVVLSVMCSCH